MDRNTIQDALLPLDHYEVENENQSQAMNRLKAFLKASGQSINTEFKKAGVLIPLVADLESNQWHIILTRRAKHLKHHPGEISFPGGRFEIEDKNLQRTAVRETTEEIGIEEKQIDLIGKLPTQATTSQYHVTPYIGVIDNDYKIQIDPNEVAEAFLLPMNFALDSNNYQKIERTINGQTFWYFELKYNHYRIWGATAQMLVKLRSRLLPPGSESV